jgi:hypothetical protein
MFLGREKPHTALRFKPSPRSTSPQSSHYSDYSILAPEHPSRQIPNLPVHFTIPQGPHTVSPIHLLAHISFGIWIRTQQISSSLSYCLSAHPSVRFMMSSLLANITFSDHYIFDDLPAPHLQHTSSFGFPRVPVTCY